MGWTLISDYMESEMADYMEIGMALLFATPKRRKSVVGRVFFLRICTSSHEAINSTLPSRLLRIPAPRPCLSMLNSPKAPILDPKASAQGLSGVRQHSGDVCCGSQPAAAHSMQHLPDSQLFRGKYCAAIPIAVKQRKCCTRFQS